MRVLYLCHRVPYPPDKGDKIRAFHQVKAMGAKHEVDLFTLADDARDMAHRAALEDYCHSVTIARIHPKWGRLRSLPVLLTQKPLTLPYFFSTQLQSAVQAAIRERSYDRIFVYCSAMAQYVESAGQIPVVMDLVDVDSDKWTQYAEFARFPLSALYRREGLRLREYEREISHKFSCVVVTTEREAELVRQLAPAATVHVIANGVNAGFFSPSEVSPEPGAPTVVFTGDMSYFPNEQAVMFFASQVLPLIQRPLPDARFIIVGRNASRKVRRLRELKGVEVTGFVPDVRVYLARAQVAVAPFSIAAGIQNKILEAMAYGLPVVATSRAVQGLSRDVAEMVETADGAEEMAAKTVSLLRDSRAAQRKGTEGRSRVMAAYSWDRALDQLLRVLENPTFPRIRDGVEVVNARVG